jgi:hypothetical protein
MEIEGGYLGDESDGANLESAVCHLPNILASVLVVEPFSCRHRTLLSLASPLSQISKTSTSRTVRTSVVGRQTIFQSFWRFAIKGKIVFKLGLEPAGFALLNLALFFAYF